MKLLGEISDATCGIGDSEILKGKYELRKSARALLFNEKGEIAVQFLKTYGYHKLPGGGVEQGETIQEALKREVSEEVGCLCQTGTFIGCTIEYRNQKKMLHISYCYTAEVEGSVGTPTLEPTEIEEGQETVWMKPADMLEKLSIDSPTHYDGHFIVRRETLFLKEYLNQCSHEN